MKVRKGISRPAIRGNSVASESRMKYIGRCSVLEECRPGAEMGLALALLRAWMAADSKPASDEEREWLKKISPICLEMIEAELQAGGTAHPCIQ